MSKVKLVMINLLGISILGLPMCVFAFGLPSFGKSSSPDISKTMDIQTKLVSDFVAGQVSILKAQANMSAALGHEKEAAQLNADAQAFSSGATNDKLVRATSDSKVASAQVSSDMKTSKMESATARSTMVTAIPEYLIGVVALTRLTPDYKSFMSSAEQQISSASIMQVAEVKDKLSVGMFVGSNGPGYVESLGDTTTSFIKYAKGNNIQIPANVSSLLGSGS